MFNVWNPYAPPEKPKPIEFALKLKPHTASGSMRLVAVEKETGARIPDGNLLKFKPDGTVYFYHTINPRLGLKLDRFGRLVEVL
jgi:hypothetical protein